MRLHTYSTHAHTYTYMYMYVHTYIHTYIHTYNLHTCIVQFIVHKFKFYMHMHSYAQLTT